MKEKRPAKRPTERQTTDQQPTNNRPHLKNTIRKEIKNIYTQKILKTSEKSILERNEN